MSFVNQSKRWNALRAAMHAFMVVQRIDAWPRMGFIDINYYRAVTTGMSIDYDRGKRSMVDLYTTGL